MQAPEKCADNIVMTGGTSGIGAHVLEGLMMGQRPCHVFLIARKSGSAIETVRRYRGTGRLTIVWADLADLGAVGRGCDELLEQLAGSEIQALALNAGILAIGRQEATVDGLEITFAVNHLAHVLLVERLKHKVARGGRIIFTSSEVHDPKAFCLVGIARARWQEPRELADPTTSQRHIINPRGRGGRATRHRNCSTSCMRDISRGGCRRSPSQRSIPASCRAPVLHASGAGGRVAGGRMSCPC